MADWSIHIEERTATNETGICFKFTEISPGIFNAVVINPEIIPPDDIDEGILSDLRQEAMKEFKKVLNRR